MAHRTIVEDYLSRTSGCGNYYAYPDISNRDKWDSLPENYKKDLINAGEEALKEPWTQLLISDFREFSKSGNRVQFEDKYFPRRRKLNKLVIAECAQNEGRFLEDILDGLYLILEETTWCLPPHTSYIRDGKQENMPDVTRPIIDLFDAESAAEVAYVEYLLRPVLKQISPFISTYVNERLKERIFDPYLSQHFWWMGNGKEPMCNWTVWCTQNVLICALTREEDFFTKEQRRAFVDKAAVSCDYFLDEYGIDGGCDEGAQYYTHAGLCLFGCLELINVAVGGSFSEVFAETLIRNVANYIVKMYVGGGYYVNFADCSALPGRRTAREYLFGKATADRALTCFAANDFKAEDRQEQLLSSEINIFYHVLQAFAVEEMMKSGVENITPEDAFFESVGLMVARDGKYTLAAKAGDNADSHNHNDVGSFTIYKDGKPFIIDLGVGTYTKRTFSDKRYEIWTMQSQFHNLPTFIRNVNIVDKIGDDPAADFYDENVVMQCDGEKFAAQDVKCLLGMNRESGISSLAMDIAGAYDNRDIRSYKRVASLNKGEGIVVEDEYDGDMKALMSLMTYEKPEVVSENGMFNIFVGDVGLISILGAEKATVKTYPIADERLSIAWKHEVYRILLELDGSNRLKMIFK